ncbi:nucleoid-associated protein [Listeria monocytogenes]
MPDFSYAKIMKLVVHFAGNKAREEGTEVSANVLADIGSEMNQTLASIFLEPFTKDEYYQFTHETDLDFNEVRTFAANMFVAEEEFLDESKKILEHLYSETTHPNIKSGDVWIFFIEGCVVDGDFTNGIGIFKVENKEVFLKNDFNGREFQIGYDKGITGTDLDKGCLIFNVDHDTGNKVLILDRLNRGDSVYWKDKFLSIDKITDEKFYTEGFVEVCTDYIKQREESLLDKSNFVKATTEYLAGEETLNIAEFARTTIEKPEEITEFNTMVDTFERENNVRFPETFQLDEEKREKLSKKIRKTIKLGKNISVVVKDLEQLEETDFVQGYDEEKGKNYMIVYYD